MQYRRSLGKCRRPWAEKQRRIVEDQINNPAKPSQTHDRAWDVALSDYANYLKSLMRRESTISSYPGQSLCHQLKLGVRW